MTGKWKTNLADPGSGNIEYISNIGLRTRIFISDVEVVLRNMIVGVKMCSEVLLDHSAVLIEKLLSLTWWIMIIWILTCSYYREYVHIKLDWSNIRKIKKIIWGCPSSSTLWTMKKHLRGFVDFNFIHMSLRDSKNHINPIIIFRDDDRIIMYDTWSNIPLKNKNDK